MLMQRAVQSLRWMSRGYRAPGVQTNWCENIQFKHQRFCSPEDVRDLQSIIAAAESSVRILGSGHSFSGAAASEGTCISLAMMRNVLDLDIDTMTVTAQGGVTYGDLCRYLAPRGVALRNVPSLPHVSVAGSISTGTHGSGIEHGNILKQVSRIQYVCADGSLVEYSRGDPEFSAAVVGLGGLGAVSQLSLDVVPAFNVAQHVYEQVPIENLQAELDNIVRACDSFSAMINFGTGTVDALMMRYFLDDEAEAPTAGPEFCGGTLREAPMEFFESPQDLVRMTHQGPWHDTLSFFMEDLKQANMPHVALQTERMVP
eukprot:TRINITY_DN39917_c0_g1_i1.p1 TRINITY_DN39917_c0_g1~~TRINITY_DN39917_c0_g1_i1.p1  ORF type:complete len:315 (+),score=65.38 TRINITY_DN39917_c0_g1_i1:37-981(+)